MIDNIKLFIQANYSDSQLAALIEHTESGKLSFRSCCCLVGGATTTHSWWEVGQFCGLKHYWDARMLPYAIRAEAEFRILGGPEDSDHLRRERLLPILYAEVERREQLRQPEYEPDYRDEEGLTDERAELAVHRGKL